MKPGSYTYTWDASKFASGVYYYKIQASDLSSDSPKGLAGPGFQQVKKLILLK
jgi:hypothetical protein